MQALSLLAIVLMPVLPRAFALWDRQPKRNLPVLPIETKYVARGPSRVPSAFVSGPDCDGRGNRCDVYYPEDVQSGPELPVVVWNNGSGRTPRDPSTYSYFLQHLASWGFIVVATRDGSTGDGQSGLASLEWLRHTAAFDDSVPFSGKVDSARAAALGHSQGATGAINMLLRGNGEVSTVVSIQQPMQWGCFSNEQCVLTDEITSSRRGSYFIIGSTQDPITPDTQLVPFRITRRIDSLSAYFEAIPRDVPKVKGLVRGASHTDVEGTPRCKTGIVDRIGCRNGAEAYLGYPVAWLKWQLEGDLDAGAAFAADTGEITLSDNWQSVQTNI